MTFDDKLSETTGRVGSGDQREAPVVDGTHLAFVVGMHHDKNTTPCTARIADYSLEGSHDARIY